MKIITKSPSYYFYSIEKSPFVCFILPSDIVYFTGVYLHPSFVQTLKKHGFEFNVCDSAFFSLFGMMSQWSLFVCRRLKEARELVVQSKCHNRLRELTHPQDTHRYIQIACSFTTISMRGYRMSFLKINNGICVTVKMWKLNINTMKY